MQNRDKRIGKPSAEIQFKRIDIPMGVVRRRLLDGSEFPGWVRAQLEATVTAALRAAKRV